MKKTKILSILGVCLAMGLTACGGTNNSSDQPGDSGNKSQQPSNPSGDASSTPKHEHKWDDGKVTTEPGCETEGVKTYTCTAEGCDVKTKTEVIPALGHQWSEPVDVAASGEGIAYQKFECLRNNKADKVVKFEVALNKALQENGSPVSEVSGMPGFVKLSGNGTAVTLKFNSDVYGTGKLWLRGSMDYWYDGSNNNENRTLFSGKDGSSVNDSKENPNLEVKVNGVALTVTNKKPMSELLPQIDETHPAAKEGNSPAGEVQYGDDLVMGKGLNEITYTRKDSYNLAVSHLLFVFVPADHAEHTFADQWTEVKAATCETDGLEENACKVCGIKQTRVIKAAHKWGEATVVAADETNGYMAYKKYECSVCHKIKYEFAAKEAKDAVTNNKTSNPATPDPYIKLKSNGLTFSIKFNAEKLLDGELYQEGIFDGWPTNGAKFGYFDVTKTDANAEQAKKTGNFEVKVNGNAIDLEQHRGKVFTDWIDASQKQTVDGTDWSLDGICPIGHISIEKGVAEIVYKRVESYNLAVKNIILVVNEFDHEHTANTESWLSDETGHWNPCSDANCPVKGVKLNFAAHTNVADESKTDTVSTCSVQGKHFLKCSVCNHESFELLPFGEHAYGEPQTLEASCKGHAGSVKVCTACGHEDITVTGALAQHTLTVGETVKNSKDQDVTAVSCATDDAEGYQMPLAAGDPGSKIASDGKVTNGSTLTYKFKVAKAGKVSVQMHAMLNSAGHDNAFSNGSDKGYYSLKAGTKEGTVTCGGKQLGADFGATESSAVYFQMGVVTFTSEDIDANGEIDIVITFPTTQDYRHKYSEFVRIIYVD